MTRRLEVDGRRVGVIDTGGDGPPLLFIHGLGGIWQNWLLNIPAFMGTHRCVAIDLPGFGLSEKPDECSIPGFARTVDKVCDELGIEEPVVIGNSMGGFVGAELAVRFPTRVSKLVLVSAAGLSTEYLSREPLLAGARAFMVLTARTGLRGIAGGQAPAAAADRAAADRALPGAAVGPAGHRARAGRQRPRLHGRLRGADELLVPRQARADRGAGADRVGAQRHARAGGGRRDVRAPDRRQRAQRDLRGHRAPADARAAEPVQRAAGRVPGRRRASRKRGVEGVSA